MALFFKKKPTIWYDALMKYAIQLSKLMKERGVAGTDLMKLTGHTAANISRLRQGKIRAVRFSTLFAICDMLDVSPGDIIIRISDEEAEHLEKGVYLINMDGVGKKGTE